MPDLVAPLAAMSSRLALGPASTGLVGTLRFRLVDNDATADDPLIGPTTDDIIEDPTGSGSYVVQYTAPAVAGKYTPFWDTGVGTTLMPDDDVVVTRSIIAPFTSSADTYVTQEELKRMLNLVGEDYFDEELDLACETASRMIDNYKNTRFYASDATRYYTAPYGSRWISIDDLLTVTSVTVDLDGDGDYETTWTEGTEFFVDPINATLNGQPGGSISLHRNTRRFPRYARGVRVEGSFGWGATPAVVKAAARLLAHRLLKRWRETPYALVTVAAAEAVAIARLGSIDPDVELLLKDIPGTVRSSLQVVQLG